MSGFQIMLFAAGLLFGVLHAAGIWRSTRRPNSLFAVIGMLRLLVVGAVLTCAALVGGIIPAACGWGLGFLTGLAVAAMAGRPHFTRQEVDW